jgi:hypothetical protein
MRRAAFVVVFSVLAGASVAGQSRPLVTEDPEVIGAGRILIETGFDWDRDVDYPLSGLRGHRLSIPTFGVSVGLSSIAEIQVDGGIYQRLAITDRRMAPLTHLLTTTGDRTHDVEDFVLATKIRLFGETPTGRPAVSLHIATKLPNASNESGLGTDMTDFFASFLIAKTVQSVRVVGNTGVAILGDASSSVPEENDLLTYGLSIARALTTAGEVVAEINGRFNLANGNSDPGSESRGVVRLGGRYTRGTVRVDAAVVMGITSHDPEIGLTAGLTWVFNAFRVP